ncbi:putative asparagine-rich zinc finger protein AZF1 [Rhexocercosporidium sp. MPI-PUGE-AT-0058]|nr:putative asparagine-rich zinc finger protein AZF1 [Rhexocercosporidium sp. MPI-PUGE-AT-0058]
MDISGIVQSYDSRAASSAALTRTIMAPQYVPAQTYSGTTTHNMVVTQQQQQHHHHQHNPFSFSGYSGPNTNMIVPAFANCNFIQQRPLPRLMQADDDGSRQVSYPRTSRQGYVEEHHSQSPPIKSEPMWSTPTSAPSFHSADIKTTPTSSQAQEINFGTEVDTLMKAIQAKAQTTQPQATSSTEQIRPVEDSSSPKNSKKRYQCTIANCNKSFYQKTHLDIHERAHTGVKPYPCKEPGCGRTFSQLGNLKTHERRHTGERPYQCEICGKRFAQRGNVRAHKIVHDQSKPYRCRLDDCPKQFTQLGNLKSHQNKFHIDTIRNLTAKFASIKDGDIVHAGDKEMWEYFANLYKNSNKGIKGRGKDRKVGSASSSASMSLNSGMRGLGMSGRGFGMAGPGRSNMIVGAGGIVSHVGGRGDGGQYEMFDIDDGSQSGHSHSGSRGASSVGYEDAPSDGYEEQGRSSNELAFGDRIY